MVGGGGDIYTIFIFFQLYFLNHWTEHYSKRLTLQKTCSKTSFIFMKTHSSASLPKYKDIPDLVGTHFVYPIDIYQVG